MKKLIVIFLSLLLLVLAQPLCVAAEENTTEANVTETITDPVTDPAEEEEITDPSTEEETFRCTCPNCVEEETTAPERPKISFGFYPSTLLTTLPIMGMGMLGIFLVTLVIVIAVLILSNIGKKSEDE